jgi:Ca2+-binding RTX toxin-like protein
MSLEFSDTVEIGSWRLADVDRVFDDGWTTRSIADDYVVRWKAPAGMHARFVRVSGSTTGDSNTQIDALIAAQLPNVQLLDFKIKPGDSTHRKVEVQYDIQYENVSELNVGIYTSPDGTARGTLLRSVTITDPAKLSVDSHSVEFTDILSGFTDPQEDYYLIAVLDPDDAIEEYDEQDNIVSFVGILHDLVAEIVHVHGGDDLSDTVQLEYHDSWYAEPLNHVFLYGTDSLVSLPANAVSEIHIRLHSGDDSLAWTSYYASNTNDGAYNLLFPTPMWVFAGEGDDHVEGGGVNDYLDGQSGNDEIHGGMGDDIVRGGDGDDYLFGDHYWLGVEYMYAAETTWPNAGSDQIFGEAGADYLAADYAVRLDTLFGQSANPKPYVRGDDTLDGGNGADELHSEGGQTNLVFGSSSTDGAIEDVFAEIGSDVEISWEGGSGGVDVHLSNSIATLVASGYGKVAFAKDGTVDTLTRSGAGTLDITTMASTGGPPRFENNEGTTRFMNDLAATAAAGPTILVNNASRVEFHSTQHLAALNISASSVAYVAPSTAPNYKALVLKTLAISTYGVLDVANNGLIVDFEAGNSPEVDIRAWLVAGRGGVGFGEGTWDGWGITSSTAAAMNATDMESRAVGYGVNMEMPLGSTTTFLGQTVDDTSVLVRFTITADLTLDGTVDDSDVTVLNACYGMTSGGEWLTGDLDYDGDVDDADATLLSALYGYSI